jgi:RNA polymerase sigma-70 factor (ECF subfamily)
MEFNGAGLARSPSAESALLCTAAPLAYAFPMDRHPDDSALMLRYKAGDTAAFESLYRRHKDALYRYLLRQCRHPATAEDVFQEVWGKIIQSRASYRPTAKFTTFIYRVARNCFIDHARRNKRHANNTTLDPELHADTSELPETLVERSLAKERLAVAIRDLPDEQRDAFLLREEAGFSVDEIASITGCNRETAKSRLRYAVDKLRGAIEEPR